MSDLDLFTNEIPQQPSKLERPRSGLARWFVGGPPPDRFPFVEYPPLDDYPFVNDPPDPKEKPRGVRFRVVVSFAVLSLLSYFMFSHLSALDYDGIASVPTGNWFLLTTLFSTIAGGVAFLSFLFTGRPW